MINEFRRARRRKIADTIPVTDAMTEVVIGRIGNLSETGMLLIASAPLVEDGLYQLRFPLHELRGRDTLFELGAHLLWVDHASAPGQSWVGLRFLGVTEDQAKALRQWIDAPGGHYE